MTLAVGVIGSPEDAEGLGNRTKAWQSQRNEVIPA